MRSHCNEKLCWPQLEKAHVHQGTNIAPVNLCYPYGQKNKTKIKTDANPLIGELSAQEMTLNNVADIHRKFWSPAWLT